VPLLAAGRAFDADAERLAEAGVKDLIDYMRPALEVAGWSVPTDVEESYDAERGYPSGSAPMRWRCGARPPRRRPGK
jgi:hypothetical protein